MSGSYFKCLGVQSGVGDGRSTVAPTGRLSDQSVGSAFLGLQGEVLYLLEATRFLVTKVVGFVALAGRRRREFSGSESF